MTKDYNQFGNKTANQKQFPFILPALPYDSKSLEPNLSAASFEYHHGKHHMAYVNNLNNLIKETDFTKADLEEIIIKTAGDQAKLSIFNNAAQIWNHSFYWNCLGQKGGGEPGGKLGNKIKEDFGSFDKFKEEFKNAGLTQFGSGWAWLVLDNNKLKVTKTLNADLPMAHNQHAILCCDVWEHAYYLDYQNKRGDFLEVFLDNLANWDFAESNLINALG